MLTIGQYFINFNGEEASEGDEVAQKPYLIRNLSIDERAVRSYLSGMLTLLTSILCTAHTSHSW